MSSKFQIPKNPNYGTGKFMRSLEIYRLSENSYNFAMEDPYHAFEARFTHNKHTVTSLSAHWHRLPMSSCSGATDALQSMIGCPLSDDIYTTAKFQDSRIHCTHQFDMLSIALTHAYHEREDRRYDVVVHDSKDGRVNPLLYLNDQIVLSLMLENHHIITSPDHYKRTSLMRGFNSWAREHLSANEREYAFIIQKAMFVAAGRQMDVKAMVGQAAEHSGPPVNSCFGSRQDRYHTATRLENIRDLSDIQRHEVLLFFKR